MKKDIKNFAKELKVLLEKYDLNLGVNIEGDFYGIQVKGFIAHDNKDNQDYYLCEYSLGLSAYDLKDFIK